MVEFFLGARSRVAGAASVSHLSSSQPLKNILANIPSSIPLQFLP